MCTALFSFLCFSFLRRFFLFTEEKKAATEKGSLRILLDHLQRHVQGPALVLGGDAQEVLVGHVLVHARGVPGDDPDSCRGPSTQA